MSNYLIHFNHNHGPDGRFTKSGSGHALSKLSKLDKKGQDNWSKSVKHDIKGHKIRSYYRSRKSGKYYKKADKYANKISTKYKRISEDKLSAKKIYVVRKYSIRFIE